MYRARPPYFNPFAAEVKVEMLKLWNSTHRAACLQTGISNFSQTRPDGKFVEAQITRLADKRASRHQQMAEQWKVSGGKFNQLWPALHQTVAQSTFSSWLRCEARHEFGGFGAPGNSHHPGLAFLASERPKICLATPVPWSLLSSVAENQKLEGWISKWVQKFYFNELPCCLPSLLLPLLWLFSAGGSMTRCC